jgi:hypothetical protein
VPPVSRIRELAADFEDMKPMFFGVSPEFKQIMAKLADLERRINRE